MKKHRDRSLPEIEAEWYAKLKDSGFDDIEDTSKPDRPLKEWHSRKFLSESAQLRAANRERYHKQLSDFLNDGSIEEICKLIVQHGNSSIGKQRAKRIIELHHAGISQRKIAKKLRVGKKCVHLTITKAKEWMKVA